MPGARPPQERQRPGGWKACQQHTEEIKANIDAFWLRPVKSIVILSSALLGATRKRKALRKAPKPGGPDRARLFRVYADWRSSSSALFSDQGARRESARTSPPLSMAASPAWPTLGPWLPRLFVASDGSPTDQHPVHGSRLFNPADEQLALLVVRVWPWVPSRVLNGVTVLDYRASHRQPADSRPRA